MDPINVTSDENGEIYAELLFGVWDIRDDVNPEFVLFDQIELEPGTDDVMRDVPTRKPPTSTAPCETTPA